jgi:hypothetical protein
MDAKVTDTPGGGMIACHGNARYGNIIDRWPPIRSDCSGFTDSGKVSDVPRQQRPRPTIALPPRARERMEARGARADQSGGPFAFTRQLERAVGFFDSLVIKSDPRKTRQMAAADYDLVLEVLTDAHELDTFHVSHLGSYLLELRNYLARARERKIDPRQLAATIDAYSFAEKLHLVDAAQERHGRSRPA